MVQETSTAKRKRELETAEVLCELANDRARLEHGLKYVLNELGIAPDYVKLIVHYARQADFELLKYMVGEYVKRVEVRSGGSCKKGLCASPDTL